MASPRAIMTIIPGPTIIPALNPIIASDKVRSIVAFELITIDHSMVFDRAPISPATTSAISRVQYSSMSSNWN